MSIYKLLEQGNFIEISTHEKEILRHLYDFMESLHPMGLDTIDKKGPCDSCENCWNHLWDAYYKAVYAFKFSLQQILIRNKLSHLNPLVEKYDNESSIGISFTDITGIDGRRSFISLSGLSD